MVIVSLTDLGHKNVANLHICKREKVLHVRFSFLYIFLFVLFQWTTLNELFELNGNSENSKNTNGFSLLMPPWAGKTRDVLMKGQTG